ncbi:MAG: hypothetical protein OXH38_12300 [Chloroflexi bacterium]|nr:hypothetical protein [Chloroflexota bacterium]
MTTIDRPEVETYARQSRTFLARSREYLAAGDLHQASEKGWGAAAHMTKAVAAARGWEYERHRDFTLVLDKVWKLTKNDRVRDVRGSANDLHGYFYERDEFLDAEAIATDIDRVAELLDLLFPLTELTD